MNDRKVLPCGFAVAAALAAAIPALASTPPPATPPAAHAEHQSPFACVPSALSPAERKQHFDEVAPRLRALCTDIRALPDGYEFSFPSDRATYQMLARWAFQERLCCPFFDVGVRLDREGGPLRLVLTGRDGVKDFIREEFRPWFSGHAAR